MLKQFCNTRLNFKAFFSVLTLAFVASNALAQDNVNFVGDFEPTQSEIRNHFNSIDQMGKIFGNCLQQDYYYHIRFHDRYGVSPFYGSATKFAEMSIEERRNYLARMGKDPSIADKMSKTSCIGLTLKCYEKAFKETNQLALYRKIQKFTAANNYDGSAMVEAFRRLGWYVMYWNPDPSLNEAYDAAEKARNPNNDSRAWGYHAYRHLMVNRHKKYFKNPVDDITSLVGFGTNSPQHILGQAPMLIGVASTGYHTYPGMYGVIIEAHSTRSITDRFTVETSKFNPIANGGAPRGKFLTGIIAVPPGYEPYRSRRSGYGW